MSLIDWLCTRQTGYVRADDGSWHPPGKPYIKDWSLSCQVAKVEFFLIMGVGTGLVLTLGWIALH